MNETKMTNFACMEHRVDKSIDAEQIADQVRLLVNQLQIMGRTDLLLRAITVPTLEQLRTEAARGTLSKLIITKDFRLILANGNREVVLTPVHRAVYLFFLKHPEGIEFKRLSEYHHELFAIYTHIMPDGDAIKMKETVDRLTNPLDNAINEKCSRIKSAFSALMDEYSASYYTINSQSTRLLPESPKVWFRRLKLISLPRELVVYEGEEP